MREEGCYIPMHGLSKSRMAKEMKRYRLLSSLIKTEAEDNIREQRLAGWRNRGWEGESRCNGRSICAV